MFIYSLYIEWFQSLWLFCSSVDDGLKWVQAEPGTRGQHLCCQVQPQHSSVPAGFLVGLHCPSLWCRWQHYADEIPAHSSSSWLRFLCRSQIFVKVFRFLNDMPKPICLVHTCNVHLLLAGPNTFLERRFRCTIKNSWFEHRPRYVTNLY